MILPVDQKFVVGVLDRKDRTNERLTMAKSIDLIQDIIPRKHFVQSQSIVLRTIQSKNVHLQKRNLLVEQRTTTKKNGIPVEQQFLWMNTYGNYLAFLHEKNTGTCCLTKNSFYKVIHNFVYDRNDMYMKSCDNVAKRVIGSAGRKKHERKYQ